MILQHFLNLFLWRKTKSELPWIWRLDWRVNYKEKPSISSNHRISQNQSTRTSKITHFQLKKQLLSKKAVSLERYKFTNKISSFLLKISTFQQKSAAFSTILQLGDFMDSWRHFRSGLLDTGCNGSVIYWIAVRIGAVI